MFSLAFHAFLRVGEITIQDKRALNPHLLSINQTKITDRSLTISFISYKHSDGQTFQLNIDRQPSEQFCPVRLMSIFLRTRGTIPGPLFTLSQNTPVLRKDFHQELKQALVFCQVDPARFHTHSFRIGAATTAASLGMPDAQIRQLGRWKSDAFKVYIRAAMQTSAL